MGAEGKSGKCLADNCTLKRLREPRLHIYHMSIEHVQDARNLKISGPCLPAMLTYSGGKAGRSNFQNHHPDNLENLEIPKSPNSRIEGLVLKIQLAVVNKINKGCCILQVQFFQDVITVNFHSLYRNAQGIGNFFGRKAFFNKGDDFDLSLRK